MMLSLLPDTATIKRNTPVSYAANNDPIENLVTVASVKCRLSIGASKEDLDPHGATITPIKVFLPDCDVTEDDTLTVDGIDYRIEGVYEVKGLRGVHHIEVDVVRVET
jgi:hypothetical protein